MGGRSLIFMEIEKVEKKMEEKAEDNKIDIQIKKEIDEIWNDEIQKLLSNQINEFLDDEIKEFKKELNSFDTLFDEHIQNSNKQFNDKWEKKFNFQKKKNLYES